MCNSPPHRAASRQISVVLIIAGLTACLHSCVSSYASALPRTAHLPFPPLPSPQVSDLGLLSLSRLSLLASLNLALVPAAGDATLVPLCRTLTHLTSLVGDVTGG